MYPGKRYSAYLTKTTTLLAINLVLDGVPRRDAAGRVEARLARGRQTSAGSPLLILATAPRPSDELSLPVALEARDRVGEPRGQHVGLDRKVEDHLVAAGRRLDARVAGAHGPPAAAAALLEHEIVHRVLGIEPVRVLELQQAAVSHRVLVVRRLEFAARERETRVHGYLEERVRASRDDDDLAVAPPFGVDIGGRRRVRVDGGRRDVYKPEDALARLDRRSRVEVRSPSALWRDGATARTQRYKRHYCEPHSSLRATYKLRSRVQLPTYGTVPTVFTRPILSGYLTNINETRIVKLR